ncbi:MAG: FtsQ-type POTRA domain-containing protein [Armatimonadota bacterium]|nr:FtsQ-type POTRA domain-containing protein [Armatimonadota bacterium]MDR7439099.1 FtsQ-type POTRA domain-containing protein [Armatimonadota bacterium]MDR7563662.1 FtsQ-type POTRA domain-containing protein [Armatimonadota bacterium]MDR7567897.1 FtsQ-type POTRA domain-containing protein [Armatimonadota bacterium]MDR7601285.1 FtsQ-type POTRA domain-containing protein [Armatimonadota bacterium]
MRWVRELRFGAVMCTIAAVFSFPDSSLFALRTVLVSGNRTLPESEVLRWARLHAGVSLARIHAEEVTARLLRHPRIRTAQVEFRWPHTIVLHVTERIPALHVVEGDRVLVVDGEGVVLDGGGENLLPLVVTFRVPPAPPGAPLASPPLQAAVRALAALPEEVRDRLLLARLLPEGSLELKLQAGPWVRVVLGDDLPRSMEVAERVVRALLRRGISVESVDLRFGDRAIVRPRGRTPGTPVE